MVKAWKEQVVIPTYEVGEPERTPIFLEKRVYQGSSGVVYPYPVIESISNEKVDKTYNAVYLENEYIKVMILPELGGRVQMAYDKIKQRHFVYYNHVVKPALVGLAGPWISGGIEFNWPQHHRPSTFLPIDSTIEENADGSVTVWVNEYERMFHQKGMAGFTLRPGCAYLEINGVLYNPTDVPQTFLWWANPAVAVNDHYQSVFPPDINAVFDHGKRAVSSFPIATGTYYKMDYSAGVDISNYKNIKVPTSYMAVNSKYDFEGGYENDTKGGMLHVASHHFSPGKKQWTWGNGDFGRAWDRNLTDEDGPYIELMAGVYTENQPDFAWLMPYEEKRFTQYFMPYRDLGVVKNASRDILFNIEPAGEDRVVLRIYATSKQHVRTVLWSTGDEPFEFNKEYDLSPENVCEEFVEIGDVPFNKLCLTITQSDTRERRLGRGRFNPNQLHWYGDEGEEIRPIPDAAEAALLPHEIKTNDQLYLTGLHLEQYRHATYSPVDYYKEALRRDPLDYRCNNALGLWYIRKGRFDVAEKYLRTAVKVLMKRNPNPYDGEPIYNLGLALKYQDRKEEAYECFWKSTWNKAWADAGYFAAAQISMAERHLDAAMDEIERCLACNIRNHKARALKATLLRLLKRKKEALAWCEESLKLDRFNYGCLFEKYLLTGDDDVREQLADLMHGMPNNYDELGLSYWAMECCEEARQVWEMAVEDDAVTLMTYYYLLRVNGDASMIEDDLPLDYCFPNRLEDINVLRHAMRVDDSDAFPAYLLGCLYYDKRQYDIAVKMWEMSSELEPENPYVWRNLALAYFNKLNDEDHAMDCMEQAFGLDPTEPRLLMELDQLCKRMQYPHEERLEFLQDYSELVEQRDDLVLEEITLLNQIGKYEQARRKLDAHIFHPWEGGEGKVPAQYQFARVELAKRYLANGRAAEAVPLLLECLEYPHHLGEGKLHGAQENDFYYFLGCAYEAMGDMDTATSYWEKGIGGPLEPAAAMYYNDAKPDKIFYAGLCLQKLGRKDEANGRFHRLVNYGKQHLFDEVRMDYFAVSLPDLLIWDDDLTQRNVIHCKYMLALGYWGLGEQEKALSFLDEVREMDINHQGIQALDSLIR